MALAALIMAMTAAPGLANKANGPAAKNGLSKGKSGVQHLELYEKDVTWDAVAGGAFGRMSTKGDSSTEDSYVFNGHGLESEVEYSLIVYADSVTNDVWPGTGPLLGTATSDITGDVHIAGDNLPTGLVDAKIWLVLADDQSAGIMTGWNPSRYLFEYDLFSN